VALTQMIMDPSLLRVNKWAREDEYEKETPEN
jgi:hypothetical protein